LTLKSIWPPRKSKGFPFREKGTVLEKSYTQILAAFPLVSLENAHVVLNNTGLDPEEVEHPADPEIQGSRMLLETSFLGHRPSYRRRNGCPFRAKGSFEKKPKNGLSVDGRCNFKINTPGTTLSAGRTDESKKGMQAISAAVKGSLSGNLSMDGKTGF
jgi:hypothetical protein